MKWIPHLLKKCMKTLINSPIKRNAISQCLVQATRPRTALMPLLFGLTVSIDCLTGSKDLIVQTARMGFSLSYDEIIRYKQSVVVNKTLRDEFSASNDVMSQFIADNVDHVVCTLNGADTFHGMGIISTSISNENYTDAIPRISRHMK